jgi:prepilin-type N-terminal cleavage/methylation domain-containing protein
MNTTHPNPFRSAAAGERRPQSSAARAFTLLEMIVVLAIIGILTSMALPHIKGMTQSNSMNAAIHQLLDDVSLARKRAQVNRTQVCMVFGPGPSFWTTTMAGYGNYVAPQVTNLFSHQYSSYALIALRSVGDQPGRPYIHYLTDWKYLPQGVFFSPYQFTNMFSIQVCTTNTMSGLTNISLVAPFPTNISFPFPSTFNTTSNFLNSVYLPYIGFLPSGQLNANSDQYIMLARGGIFYPIASNGSPIYSSPVDFVETPAGNDTNNPNLIHIDMTTSRAKVEQNQF